MQARMIFIGVGLILGLMLIYAFVFTVHQTQYALKLQFGKIVSADYAPGLNFKLPIIQQILYFDKRIQNLDAAEESFLTSEKKNLTVDSFIKWQIVDAVTFFTSVGGNMQRANQRLAEIIADGLRSKIAARTIQEVVSGDRVAIMTSLTEEAQERTASLGIVVIDVRIKRIDLPQTVSQSVYRRMEAERERVAKELRSRGEAEAVRIQADANRQRTVLLAEAERKAEEIRGDGDAQATKIYAEAFLQDEEFYAFYRSLNAYRSTFKQKSDILVIEPDSDFFAYFKQAESAITDRK